MKTFSKGILLAIVMMFVASSGFATETLKQFDGIKGRTYHSDFYNEKACDSCHSSKAPLSLPADDACVSCHDLKELIDSTSRPEDEKWQNPHNNMHYGKDVPCMECHGEHESRKPLCQGCHSFKYTKFNQ